MYKIFDAESGEYLVSTFRSLREASEFITGYLDVTLENRIEKIKTHHLDKRYSIRLEWCGARTRRHVVRFCGDWLGQSANKAEAIKIARQHYNRSTKL